tara:strand:- start:226 stop:495 length:270 start_codon:yes stop_codon:yes gene_type:complete
MEGLAQVWEQFQANPVLLGAAVVVAVFLVFGLIKRILTIALLSGALLILYFIYVTNFQDRFPLPDALDGLQERWLNKDNDSNASPPVSP